MSKGSSGTDRWFEQLKAVRKSLQGVTPTVIYVHGVGDQEDELILKDQWDEALFGQRMGARTRFAYWVDRDTHPSPDNASTEVLIDELSSQWNQTQGAIGAKGLDDHLAWVVAQTFADVRVYFNKPNKRSTYQQILAQQLQLGEGPYIVISHSLGSVIAYEVLSKLSSAGRSDVDVALWVTLGSPLTYSTFRKRINQHLGRDGKALLKTPSVVKHWMSIADSRDILVGMGGPMAASVDLSSLTSFQEFFGPSDEQRELEYNKQLPDRHRALGYLCAPAVREALHDWTAKLRHAPVSGEVVSNGLQRKLDSNKLQRQRVLIELAGQGTNLVGARQAVKRMLREAAEAVDLEPEDQCVDDTLDYVVADLSRTEVHRLRGLIRTKAANATSQGDQHVKRLWASGVKRALIDQSIQTVQVAPAQVSYKAFGKGVTWAVLDTGIDPLHPHFLYDNKTVEGTIQRSFDCTVRGAIRACTLDTVTDDDGHGTHVAGIIAGASLKGTGMAPEAKLWSYKTLKRGFGDDVWIIKALDHIWTTNNQAGRLVVAGVNLSLGGPYDVESYNCGFTPLCNVLRKLWRQGVLVVIAAGNEGMVDVLVPGQKRASDAASAEVSAISLDLSLADPGNLEEAIVVGSVHKRSPGIYGVSYFSSKGPTADGRAKPDCVAPGEKILSANFGWRAGDLESERLVEMSGTSMAAPHVSGLLAAFLGARKDHVGRPDQVKALMLRTATDLGRDKYFQGAGVPSLFKMLLEA